MNKSIIHLLLLALLLSMLPAVVQAQGPGRRAYLAAENFRKQNKCEDAIAQYNEAITLEPTNFKYYFQKGKCEYKLKDYESAKESFKNTVSYKKDFTAGYSLLAKLYKNEKDYDNAIYYYEEATRYENNATRKVQYQLLLVNLLLKENRPYDAQKHINDAAALDPDNPNILYYKAEIAADEGRWEEARRDYERALDSDRLKNAPPAQKAKYYYGHGLALSNLGDNAGAKRSWEKANFGPYKRLISQQMLKTNHVYYYKIAVSYYLNGEYDQSEQYLQKALDIQKDFSSAFVLKGKIEGKKGNINRAIDHYQRAIDFEQSPEKKAKMYRLVANLQLNNNDSYNALSSIEKGIQASPTSAGSLYYLKAKAEYDSGRYNDAIRTLETLLSAGVDTKSKAKYNFILGMAAKKAGDYEKARDAFKNSMYGPYKPAAQIELESLTEKR